MLMGTDNGAINKDISGDLQFIRLESFPQGLPDATGFPSPEAIVHGIPRAKMLRQVAPGYAGTGYVQHRFDKHPVTLLWRSPALCLISSKIFGNIFPRLISEYQSFACTFHFPLIKLPGER